MTKFLRCSAPHCRTLTGDGLCDKHRAPAPAARPDGWKTDAEWAEILTEAKRLAGLQLERRKQRAALRDDLAALRDGAEKMARRFERPVFAGEC